MVGIDYAEWEKIMFESLALEDPRNTTRNWTTAVSFALQVVGIGVLIIAPLGYTQAISLKAGEPLVAPAARVTNLETRGPQRPPKTSSAPPMLTHNGVLTYTGIPHNVRQLVDAFPDGSLQATVAGVADGTPTGNSRSLIDNIIAGMHISPPVHAPATHSRPLIVSHLDPGLLVKQVQPKYPRIAQITHIEGTVLLAAVIDTQGRIVNLRALSGHPYLIPAALDAVQQWRYRPYILNGSAIAVETQISVIFSLEH
jgi:protein TonB